MAKNPFQRQTTEIGCHESLKTFRPRKDPQSRPKLEVVGIIELYHVSPVPPNQCWKISRFLQQKGKKITWLSTLWVEGITSCANSFVWDSSYLWIKCPYLSPIEPKVREVFNRNLWSETMETKQLQCVLNTLFRLLKFPNKEFDICGLFRCLPRDRVGFLRFLILK